MKSKTLFAMGAACWLGFVGSASAAVVTESINFNDNLMPSGWNYVLYSAPFRNNLHIQNQRLEIGAVDTSGGIYRSFSADGVTEVRVQYDGNIAPVFWGEGTATALMVDYANHAAGYAVANMAKWGFGVNQMYFGATYYSSGEGSSGAYEQRISPPVFGNYHMDVTFREGYISQTVTNLDTLAQYASGDILAPLFHLSSMNYLGLWGTTTTGESAWLDNILITTTTADSNPSGSVPEPTTLALLLSAFGVMRASRRS